MVMRVGDECKLVRGVLVLRDCWHALDRACRANVALDVSRAETLGAQSKSFDPRQERRFKRSGRFRVEALF